MKLVLQSPKGTKVMTIRECDLLPTIDRIKTSFEGMEQVPKDAEIFRFRLYQGSIIIYKDNKIQKSRTFWYEMRALSALSRELGTEFFHGVTRSFAKGQSTEIDGVDVEEGRDMVEIKHMNITQEWIDYYDNKRQLLKFKQCYIMAPRFEENLHIPPDIQCYLFKIDLHSIMQHYNEHFRLPSWIESYLPARHVRILLNNGRWYGIKRKLTWSAKHTPSSKILLSLNRIRQRHQMPIRVYYTLSPMLIPVEEYHGHGRPFPKVIAALDVDAAHRQHVIGPEGYCKSCFAEAENKAALIEKQLVGLGWKYTRIYSGSKGVHFYLLEDGGEQAREMPINELETLVRQLRDDKGNPLTDNVNFRAKDGSFDTHRIFKLPATIDVATGILAQEHLERLSLNDYVVPLKF